MFGSNNSFGQTSSNPFGSQSPFGQTSNANTNPFAPKPFGSPTASPFGAQTGSSIFGSTSTGVFGQTPSPLATTPTFGASSSPSFGSSTPAFGSSSTPAFGSSSSPFGGSSLFGQKPAFGGFGSTPAQSSPFGSTVQKTQPVFGTNTFGSTSPFGASSQPSFGATSSPAFGSTGTSLFGATSTPAFGATSTPAFDTSSWSTPGFGASSTPAFGATSTPSFGSTNSWSTPGFGASSTPAFGATSTPSFGSTNAPAFGAQSTPAFGSTSTPNFGSTAFGSTGTAFGGSSAPAFGAGSSSLFGSSSTPAFGASSTPTFGSSGTPAFGSSSTPSFSFGSAPAFGQSTSTFGSSPFGTTSFGAQTSPFGSQTTTPAFGSPGFGQPAFGGQRGGSRVVAYTPTVDTDGATGSQPAGKLESISAMPAYKEKSHEELRWEDYQQGDKGGPNPAGQTAAGVGFSSSAQSSPFGSTGTFGQAPASAFPSTGGGLLGQKAPVFGSSGFGSSSAPAFSSPFGSSSSSPFGLASVSSFSASSTPSLFGSSVTSAFGTPSPFGSSTAGGSTPAFGSGLTFGNTQSAGLFHSSPATGQTPSLFGQPSTGFGQSASTFGSSLFGTQSNTFGGSLFGNSTPSLAASTLGFGQSTPSLSNPFQASAPPSGGFSFGNFGQPQQAQSGFGVPGAFGQTTFSQSNANQMNTAIQATTFANPFGTLPAMPEISIGHAGSSSPIQYGISSMPVAEKTAPIRISSLLIPRHLSQRRIRVPVRKFRSKSDGPRVPFFYDEDEVSSNPKADALFIPRENPKALIFRPIDQWPAMPTSGRESFRRNRTPPIHENGKVTGEAPGSAPSVSAEADGNAVERNGHDNDQNGFYSFKGPLKVNGFHENQIKKGMDSSYMTMSGNRAGEAAIVYEHGADIEALMPKLRHPEYYTEPRIQELAAKERAEAGFCCHVRDFVVGRRGFGSIKFEGETDVRRLDLESLIQFNYREVIVYKDDSKKPPVGQGLNKPAEVTLLNVKCIEKKTGHQFTDGPKVENYKELLERKAAEQGAEFVSYDAAKGEWKFKVKHFSCYGMGREYSDALVTLLEVIGRYGNSAEVSNDFGFATCVG